MLESVIVYYIRLNFKGHRNKEKRKVLSTVREKRSLEDLEYFIGNTPLAEIQIRYRGKFLRVFAKLESYNFSGSYKDRIAQGILKEAYRTGELKRGDTIVEATSGNTGIAFAALAAYLDHPIHIYMPDWMSQERIQLLDAYGAEIILVSKEEGGFVESIRLAEEKGKEEGYFYPGQFENPFNPKSQQIGLGKELVRDLDKLGLKPDLFVAGVGTGGAIMGVGKAILEVNPKAKIHPLEPAEARVLSDPKNSGVHRIGGISDQIIPEILKLEEIHQIVSIHDGDAILMAQKLMKNGLGVGISAGANFLGAVKMGEYLGETGILTTAFADNNSKYLSTDLMKEEEVKDNYLSKDIEILKIISHR